MGAGEAGRQGDAVAPDQGANRQEGRPIPPLMDVRLLPSPGCCEHCNEHIHSTCVKDN